MAAPRRTIPRRLPSHGRALGRLGQRDRRHMARRSHRGTARLEDARDTGDHRQRTRPRTLKHDSVDARPHTASTRVPQTERALPTRQDVELGPLFRTGWVC